MDAIAEVEMDDIRELVAQLGAGARKGHGRMALERQDALFMRLAERYRTATDADREEIRRLAETCRGLFLVGFGDRMAILAANTRSVEALRLGFLAHSIEDFRYDVRENIMQLAVLYHVARRLGESPSLLSQEAQRISSPAAARELRSFDERRPEMRSLRVMGLKEVQTEKGIDFLPLESMR